MADKRLTLTIPSGAYAHLLAAWATLTDRTMGSLGGSLLEDGIKQAIRDGVVPQMALEQMDAYMRVNAEHYAEEMQEALDLFPMVAKEK